MRAVLQSAYTVTTGLGNLLVVLVEASLNKVLVRVSNALNPKYFLSNFLYPIIVPIGVLICWSHDP